MRYIGGKARTAKRIAEHLKQAGLDCHTYLEPFLGGASVAAEVSKWFNGRCLLGDVHPDIALLWNSIANGWIPPSEITREQYHAIKHDVPSALKGWTGFACSYNGKYFGGYGPKAVSAGRDYLDEAQRAALRKAPLLKSAEFYCTDYREWNPADGYLVYCDPPYVGGVLGYHGSGSFDTNDFWATMDAWSSAGAIVLVSEYEAPNQWSSIMNVARTATVHHAGSPAKRIEGLYRRR